MRSFIETIGSHGKVGVASVILLAAVAGVLSGWLTPRGPVSTPQALITIAAALAVGMTAGMLVNSRWTAILAPVIYVVVFEMMRSGVEGPTVDAIILDNIYGIIAFVSGRLVHWILAVLPMMIGVVYGSLLAAWIFPDRVAGLSIAGWALTGLASAGIIGVTIFILRPASTHAVLGSDGHPLTGSVAELIEIPVGGQGQTLMIRGRDENNPVLLYLAGGPGGTDLGAMRADTSLEEDFVVVTWDQRGTGKSYPAIDPIETLTTEQMVSDTIAITNYLRDRFDEEKIYLVGNSWGTVLGVLAVQQHPELYHAYVGTGQMVSLRETDIMFYEDTLAWAEQNGQDDLVETLEQNGPPPYDDLLDYEPIINHEHDWNAYPGMEDSVEMPFNTFVPENTFMDRVNALRGLLDTYSALYPQLQEIDFRNDVAKLDVPFYMVTGIHEARGRSLLAREWFEMLDAPSKKSVIFERSGHRPLFEEPAEFSRLMQSVLAETHIENDGRIDKPL